MAIEYGALPDKARVKKKLKWEPVLREVMLEAPTDDGGEREAGKVAVRPTASAANSLGGTLRRTAEALGLELGKDVQVASRPENPENSDDGYGVWVAPLIDADAASAKLNGSAPKKAAPKKTTKAKTTTKAKSTSSKSKSSGGRRRRTTAAKS